MRLSVLVVAIPGVVDCVVIWNPFGRRQSKIVPENVADDSSEVGVSNSSNYTDTGESLNSDSGIMNRGLDNDGALGKTPNLIKSSLSLHNDLPEGFEVSTALHDMRLHVVSPTPLPILPIFICVKLAGLAYLDGKEQMGDVVSQKLPAIAIVNSQKHNPEGVDAHVVFWYFEKSRTVVVAYRGTESTNDMRADMETQLMPGPAGGLVHAGFLKYYMASKRWLTEQLHTWKGSYDKLIFTGHSLGGAQATLAAADAKALLGLTFGEETVTCITFGSPRVGDTDFVKGFNTVVNSSIRIVYGEDVVARVPTSTQFIHVGPAHVFAADGTWIDKPEKTTARNTRVLKGRGADHKLTQYLSAITNAMKTFFSRGG